MLTQVSLSVVWEFILNWYWIPLGLVYLTVISTILIENRNPSKTIAWILVIVFLPILGVLLYYLFGQKYIKELHYKANHRHLQQRLNDSWDRLDPWIQDSLIQLEQGLHQKKDVFAFLAKERVSPPIPNNHVQLLTNGEEKFPALLRALKSAQDHIHLEYYIFEEGSVGLRILKILTQKAEEGVKVRLLIDGFGSAALAKKARKWQKKGLELQVFMPVGIRSMANNNYRNHRKLALIDGSIAFIGGINISDKYFNAPGEEHYWRDTALKIEGAAVNVLQTYFFANWILAGGEDYKLTSSYFYTEPLQAKGNTTLTFAMSDPGSISSITMEALLLAISSASKRVILCTPYFIPTDELSTALQLAVARGVHVELFLPARSDSYIVQHASMSFLKPLLQRGVQVYLYEKGFIHAKTFIVDDALAGVGTVNLDTRSFYINFESMAILYDPNLVEQMMIQTQIDKQGSRLLTLDAWMNRPSWKRGLDSLCRLLAPLL